MKAEDTIRAMRDRLHDSIFNDGWEAQVEGALTALAWVLSDDFSRHHDELMRYMNRPEEERKRIWVAFGGDPDEWRTDV